MYFAYKHIETEPNSSHELVTFRKYHMLLKHIALIFECQKLSNNQISVRVYSLNLPFFLIKLE